MYWLLIKYNIIFLYLFIISIELSKCYTAKHSKYKKFALENIKICSEVATRKVELKRDRENGLIITQTTTSNHVRDWTNNKKCKFIVESDEGLFAVIQNINFRKNYTTGQCIDFVQFETRQHSYGKFCGNWNIVNMTDFSDLQTNENEDFVEIDLNGYIVTTIFISKESWTRPDEMNLKIVYTKFKRCDGLYIPCKLDNYNMCILPDYLNDSLVNCPFKGCLDETSCSALMYRRFNADSCGGADNHCSPGFEDQINSTNSTKIILSAVTSLIISFAVFIVCIWFCKKTAKCYDLTRTVQQPNSRVIEMQNRNEAALEVPAPTAHQQQPTVPNPDPEKDLPPSYESLFPSR